MQAAVATDTTDRLDGQIFCEVHRENGAASPRRFLGALVRSMSHDGPSVCRGSSTSFNPSRSREVEYGGSHVDSISIRYLQYPNHGIVPSGRRGRSSVWSNERTANRAVRKIELRRGE